MKEGYAYACDCHFKVADESLPEYHSDRYRDTRPGETCDGCDKVQPLDPRGLYNPKAFTRGLTSPEGHRYDQQYLT
jgi:hypothetical protein